MRVNISLLCLLITSTLAFSQLTLQNSQPIIDQQLSEIPCAVDHCKQCNQNSTIICQVCEDGWYLGQEKTICVSCSDAQGLNVTNCDKCGPNYKGEIVCQHCQNGLFANKTGNQCSQCSELIDNCTQCEDTGVKKEPLVCLNCTEGYHVSDDTYSCVQDSPDSNMAQVIAGVMGGLAVVGIAYYAFIKCRGPKKVPLLNTQDNLS